jgi:hypothetical protein
MTTTTSTHDDPQQDRRRVVRVAGDQTLAELAVAHFDDERVAPLLVDLNPAVGLRRARAGDTVTLPSKRELSRFAACMGFQVGYRPETGGSTSAKKKWSAMRDGGARASTRASATDLARLLLGQALPVEVAAKRLLALVDETEARLFANGHVAGELAPLAAMVSTYLFRLDVRARMKRLADAAVSSSTPDGRRVLIECSARDPKAVAALLAMCLVPDEDAARLVAASRHALALMRRADELANLDVHARDALLSAPGADVAGLRSLVDALVDGAPLCANERLAVLGVRDVLAAIEGHTNALAGLLKRLVEQLDETSPATIAALVTGDVRALERPWPVVAALLARLGPRLDRVHAGQVERGLVALAFVDDAEIVNAAAPKARVDTNPRLSVAELQARSAVNARVSDAHDGVPERLSAAVVALFDPLRPSAPDTGSEPIVQKRRQARFEKAVLVGRHGTTDGDVCAALVDELIELARGHHDATVKRRADRVTAEVRRGALALARKAREPIAVLLRNASEVGRALIVTAIALDPELGPALARPSGQEAALEALKTHAARTLALSTQVYAKAR